MARETTTPSTITAVLGGTTYEVHPLALRAERQWKQAAEQPVDALLGLLEANIGTQLNSAADLVPMLREMKTTLLYATDTILDLCCAYSPAIAMDRERIEEEAFTPEVIDLFVQIVSVVFPLARLTGALRGLGRTRTSANSPARNGA